MKNYPCIINLKNLSLLQWRYSNPQSLIYKRSIHTTWMLGNNFLVTMGSHMMSSTWSWQCPSYASRWDLYLMKKSANIRKTPEVFQPLQPTNYLSCAGHDLPTTVFSQLGCVITARHDLPACTSHLHQLNAQPLMLQPTLSNLYCAQNSQVSDYVSVTTLACLYNSSTKVMGYQSLEIRA